MADNKMLNIKGTLLPRKPKEKAAEPVHAVRHRKWARGVVVSDKMNKTRVVRVDRQVQDKFYKKYGVSSNKLKAHDEKNDSRVGDLVMLVATRPLSREKRWAISKIERRAGAGAIQTVGGSS